MEITADTCRIVLIALYNKKNSDGDDDEAEKLWSLMKEKDCIDVDDYNVRLEYMSGGVPKKVKAMIVEMVDAGLKPNTVTYKAKEFYAGLDEKGCRPNFLIFRTLVFYLYMNKDFERGFKGF